MPIHSYLAYAKPGELSRLSESLASHPHCDVHPAENADVAILVTDTTTDADEAALHEFLQNTDALQCLAMVYGAEDPEGECDE